MKKLEEEKELEKQKELEKKKKDKEDKQKTAKKKEGGKNEEEKEEGQGGEAGTAGDGDDQDQNGEEDATKDKKKKKKPALPDDFKLGDLESLWMSAGQITKAAPVKIVYKVEKGKYYNGDVNLKLTDDLEFSMTNFDKVNKGLMN